MSDILCCRYIIVLWNLNLISKDIFGRRGNSPWIAPATNQIS